MRYASHLCRRLAEASRSLERPYIPRHVPLPSSSCGAAAKSSTIPTAPKTSDSCRGSKQEAKLSQDASSNGSHHQDLSLQRPSPKRHQSAQVDFQHQHFWNGSPSPRLSQDSRKVEDDGIVLSTGHTVVSKLCSSPVSVIRRQPAGAGPSVQGRLGNGSYPSASATDTGSAVSNRKEAAYDRRSQAQSASADHVERLMIAYPSLTKPQADFLLRTFRLSQSLRSHAPNIIFAWYEDMVWKTDRQAQASEKIESTQSLSLLLRFAYQRNDLRSLLRIERRAARLFSIASKSQSSVAASSLSPKELGNTELDGVCIWPEPNEDPSLLAYNLKVAFAAKAGNWVKVEELLHDANLPYVKTSKILEARRGSASASRSALILDAIGWGSLLRFGLGSFQTLDAKDLKSITAAPLSEKALQNQLAPITTASIGSTIASGPHDVEEERVRKAKEADTQAQAKLSVTERFFPYLLQYTTALKGDLPDIGRGTLAGSAEPTTPAWLLQSMLAQLAERGDAASTVRIAQLALSERSAVEQLTLVRGGTASILNLALGACVQNSSVNLTETLRIFNNLTGSQLGLSISGPTVLADPSSAGVGKVDTPSNSHRAQDSGKQKQEEERSGEESVGQARMIPNEESLILVLKKVSHPLFRAAWTSKLVDDFQRLFPKVKLSGRTFRMIVDKCVAPAPSSGSQAASLKAVVFAEQLATTGRCGRRLRQHASQNDALSAASTPPNAVSHKRRGPIIKQTILAQTLAEILNRFRPMQSNLLHLSTTNRRKFEHTLLRAKGNLLLKKQYHKEKIESAPSTVGQTGQAGFVRHHQTAIVHIDEVVELIAKVQRLGRSQDAQRKKRSPKHL